MTTLRTPDSDLDRAFAIASRRGEALLTGTADRWADPGELRLAAALLGAGVRAPARSILRAIEAAGTDLAAAGEAGFLMAAYRVWVGDGVHPAEPDSSRRDARRVGTELREAVARVLRDPEGASGLAMSDLLDAVILDLWGLEPDAPARSLVVRPRIPEAWPSMALERVRVGGTVLDLTVRRRWGDLVARVHRAAGPTLVVTVEPDPALPGPAVVDDIELAGGRARFEAVERHEIVFRGALS